MIFLRFSMIFLWESNISKMPDQTSRETCQPIFDKNIKHHAQKRGPIGPKIRRRNWAMFWFVLVCSCMFGFFMGFQYSKMANLGSQTYSNTFWIILGTSKNRPKMDPRTPYSLQKYFKTYKDSTKPFKQNNSWMNMGIYCFDMCVPTSLCVRCFFFLKFHVVDLKLFEL